MAVRLRVDSWRWAGVPFLIRAGKRMPVTATEVVVQLAEPPQRVFDKGTPNRLRFQIGPDLRISLDVRAKTPGEGMTGCDESLVLDERPHDEMEPYERLLGDAMKGDQQLFAREDTVEAAWRVVDGILGDATPIHFYEPGSWGPPEADHLLPRGAKWLPPRLPGDQA